MKQIITFCAAAALSAPAFADQPVTINFAAEIGGAAFSCTDTYDDIGATKASVAGSDYRMFVSAPALVRADGTLQPIALDQDGKWQLDDLALLDFEDGTAGCNGTGNADMNTALHGTVPEGEYTGLAFNVAVPFEKNHGDPTLAPSPLNATGMFWNWRGGYRFVRIDMVPTDRADDGPKGWFLHLGSTMCAADSKTESPSACANPNTMPVLFTDFDPANNVVVIDPAPVVADADLRVNAPETSPGCMSFPNDDDCLTVMQKLGVPFHDIPAAAQQLLTVR
jgi:uncharacterized repeat protein (TIGR04052 family)